MKIADLVAEARAALREAPFEPSPREAHLLLGHVLGLDEAAILAHWHEEVGSDDEGRFRDLLARRLKGEPVAFLRGEKEFYGRPFAVDSRVLVPRPETEHLVAAALRQQLPPRPRILDLGTGSGCLAVTLVLELEAARAVATDVSPAALAVAAKNRRRHAVADRVELVAADLGTALRLSAFDLVVANPPYVGTEEAAALSPEVRCHEPATALFAGPGGTAVLDRLLGDLAGLRAGVPLVLEIGRGQLAAIERRAATSPFAIVTVEPDYAGIPRVVVLRHQ